MTIFNLGVGIFDGIPKIRFGNEGKGYLTEGIIFGNKEMYDFQAMSPKNKENEFGLLYEDIIIEDPFAYKNLNFTFQKRNKYNSDVSFTLLGNAFLVSDKVYQVLSPLQNEYPFDFYPTLVEKMRWWIMRWDRIPIIDCLDKNNSNYEKDEVTGHIYLYKSIWLLKDKINKPLFCIPETRKKIFTNQNLVDILVESKIIGFDFRDIKPKISDNYIYNTNIIHLNPEGPIISYEDGRVEKYIPGMKIE